MADDLRPNVQGATLETAHALWRHHEDRFKQIAKAVERMPATKRVEKRRRRALTAIGHLRSAIFWKVICVEHPTQPPEARVAKLIGEHELAALWVEAAERARMAAREGALHPNKMGKALAVAAQYVPGQGDLPRRGVA